uniref:Uncharacterized protein n=1 Tax=Cairina moschata TaxID=8855 RepID=A0A8C3C824_CAIMO
RGTCCLLRRLPYSILCPQTCPVPRLSLILHQGKHLGSVVSLHLLLCSSYSHVLLISLKHTFIQVSKEKVNRRFDCFICIFRQKVVIGWHGRLLGPVYEGTTRWLMKLVVVEFSHIYH